MYVTKAEVVNPTMLPPGKSGNFELTKEILKKRIYSGGYQRPEVMDAGECLVRLMENGHVWMSNTPAEGDSNSFPIETLVYLHSQSKTKQGEKQGEKQ